MAVRGGAGLWRVSATSINPSSSLTPRSFSGGASLAESQSSSLMERGSAELRRLQAGGMPGSSRNRPAVSSSPTEGSLKTSHSFNLPPSLVSSYSNLPVSPSVVGFQVESKNPFAPGLPKGPSKVKGGLLARALTTEEEVRVGASTQMHHSLCVNF